MKNAAPLFLFTVLIVLTQSCTLEKRLYNRGFHLEWKKRFHARDSDILQSNEVSAEEVKNEHVTYQAKPNSPHQDSVIIQRLPDVIDLETPKPHLKKAKKHAFSFTKTSTVKKVVHRSNNPPNSNLGRFLRSVFVVLLICVILPSFFFLLFASGISLDIILSWLIVILLAALIAFFIVRIILTAIRY